MHPMYALYLQKCKTNFAYRLKADKVFLSAEVTPVNHSCNLPHHFPGPIL
jgi:hypothetical protein